MSQIISALTLPSSNYVRADTRIVLLDGEVIEGDKEFLWQIWTQLNFPENPHPTWDAYLDWMTDLSWIKERNILIIIDNFGEFLREKPKFKFYFVEDYVRKILPFWEKDYIEIYEDEAFKKNIILYLVSKEEQKMEKIKEQLEQAGYDYAIAIATQAEIEAGAACGQLSIICEEEK